MSCSLARQIDRMGYGDTPIHNVNPAAKILAALIFVFTIASYPKYSIIPLLPYFIIPIFWASVGKIRWSPILKVIIFLSPFAVAPALLNPLLDRNSVNLMDRLIISAGWLSLISAIIRFILSLMMVLVLAATTSMAGIISGLQMFGLPKAFINQLHMLYRYLFLLVEEGITIQHARLLRQPAKRLPSLVIASRMISTLAIKAFDRAERIYSAMQLRAHNDTINFYGKRDWLISDILFLVLWGGICLIQRIMWLM